MLSYAQLQPRAETGQGQLVVADTSVAMFCSTALGWTSSRQPQGPSFTQLAGDGLSFGKLGAFTEGMLQAAMMPEDLWLYLHASPQPHIHNIAVESEGDGFADLTWTIFRSSLTTATGPPYEAHATLETHLLSAIAHATSLAAL